MKNILFLGAFSLMFGLTIFGQTTKADLERLRKEIGLSPSVSVSKDNVFFPNSKPTKIYLAIKHNKKSAKDFAKWVEQWNKTNAVEFGEIQMVDDLDNADIAAVQYQYGVARIVREDSAQLKIGKIRRENGENNAGRDDGSVLGSVGNSSVRVKTSAKNLTLPLYSYLIVREQNSSWAVNYSRVDERLSGEHFPELLLQSEIESRLKNR